MERANELSAARPASGLKPVQAAEHANSRDKLYLAASVPVSIPVLRAWRPILNDRDVCYGNVYVQGTSAPDILVYDEPGPDAFAHARWRA